MPKKFDLAKFRREHDTVMEQGVGRTTDIVIPRRIMGPTGVGKSTFVNNVLTELGVRTKPANTSNGFKSCTDQLAHYIVDVPKLLSDIHPKVKGRRLVLVDTPGFDDTNLSDSEILRRIAVWLASSYDSKMRVGGVVYLFPIYPNRITRNDRSNIKIFQRLCGQNSLTKIILATTRWDICPSEAGESRELELRTNFWSDMLPQEESEGALLARLENTPESALGIIHRILERYFDQHEVADMNENIDGIILKMQDQLVKRNKILPETDAARELRRKLEELMKESRGGDPTKRKERLQRLVAQAKDLKIPLGKRIMGIFGM
ncbi:P-loop containing nucleoside triphosphate hydrolase protein [Ephemerocybe angulata]|uniref:P-loop containing nucleoside triphosphate hydrolase protein n=1 Tax=Ephemerocybe angulata TaxID=980116 RepID=A0A8H6HRG6_9AGAR|nr:P-loop containing nucleoside triphosphate hydrolase protein [Tulosesus angulatus]